MSRAPLSRWLSTAAAVLAGAAFFGAAALVAGRAASVPGPDVSAGTTSPAGASPGGTDSSGSIGEQATPGSTVAPRPLGTRVAMVGDSLTEGVRARLLPLAQRYGFDVKLDAQTGRDIQEGLSSLKKITSGRDLVVVALGTNDARASLRVADARVSIEQALAVVGDKTPVLWVNIYRADTKDAADAALRFDVALDAEAAIHANLTVLDWRSFVKGRPALMGTDQIHLTSAGYDERAAWLARAIADELRLPEPETPAPAR